MHKYMCMCLCVYLCLNMYVCPHARVYLLFCACQDWFPLGLFSIKFFYGVVSDF